MRLSEITGPKTPDQLRMDTLRATQKRASNAVKMERNRQKVQSAQKAIQQLRAPKLTTLEPIKPMGSHSMGSIILLCPPGFGIGRRPALVIGLGIGFLLLDPFLVGFFIGRCI